MKAAAAVLVAVMMIAVAAQRAAAAQPAQTSNTTQELRALLDQFLAGASNNDRAVFERFFADDLIYTRNSGQTTTKAAILKSLPAQLAPSGSTYSAEDVTVHDYGNAAVVNFVLVAKDKDGKVTHYRNTGTFVKRNGEWQAVAWQATKISDEKK